MTAIDLEFLPTDANKDRGVQYLEFVLQQMHKALTALTSYEGEWHCSQLAEESVGGVAETTEAIRSTTGGRKRNRLRTIISPGRCSFWNFKRVSNAGSLTCLAARRG